MVCQNNGPWHLGISDEACENAGGEWFRTPCITLKETIDNRPPRFDLENPMDGSCQDTLGRLETAFVSASTDHANFTFTNTKDGCFKFCQSLPNYPSQTGMMIKHKTLSYVKVRVHLKEAGILSLGEVQVLDSDGVDMALNQPATQSSSYNSLTPVSNAVNGNPATFTHTSADEKSEPEVIFSLAVDYLS